MLYASVHEHKYFRGFKLERFWNTPICTLLSIHSSYKMQFHIFALATLFSAALALPQPQADVALNTREATEVLGRAIHGQRSCFGGGITCNYADGSRCSKVCEGKCWCPDGHWDNGVYHDGYSGAGCVHAITAGGRHQCG